MAIKVGINGFGRIGRNILRTALTDAGLDFVALLAAFALGVLSRSRVGAWHPQDSTYVIHYVVGLAAVAPL